MLGSLAKKIFGTANARRLKAYAPQVVEVNDLEQTVAGLSDEALAARTVEFRAQLAQGKTLDDIAAEAFATVREAAKRVLGQRHFDVQLIGGMVLHEGAIAEMRTGEGKTLVATLATYLNALAQKGVHVVTVNDYLARRDAEWMGQIYKFLGLSVGIIVHGLDDDERRVAYAADITYGTNNEYGFDYLRDNMKYELDQMVQRGHAFAIVDEVDSILVDEARTPLIISGPSEDRSDLYAKIDTLIPKLVKPDYDIDEKQRTANLTETGNEHIEALLGEAGLLSGGSLYESANATLGPPRPAGLAGPQTVPSRQGLHRPQRRGRHHRRVFRPHDAGASLFGRPAPGAGSEGARRGPARERDPGVDHLPELFPALQEARRHDRNGCHRSQRIRRDLQTRRRRDPDQPRGVPTR